MEPANDPATLSVGRRLRFLARDSLIYGGAAAVNAAFGLITFPLLARHFSVADYGLIDLFIVTAGLMATAFVFGQDAAVARYFYEYTDVDRRRQIVSQSLALQMGVVFASVPLLWHAAGFLSRLLSHAPESEALLKLILLQVPFQVLINFAQNLLKWTFSRTRFLFISMGSVALRVLILLGAVIWFNIGVEGVFVIILVVQATFGLVGLAFVRQWIARPKGMRFLRELLPFAIPYGVICIIAALVPALERTIVSRVLGSAELGLYAAGAKVAMLISFPIQAFQMAWGPFSLAVHKQADAPVTFNWVLKIFVLGICGCVLLITTFAEPAIRLLASDRYSGAAVVVFPLAMGLAIQATSWIMEIGIGLSKKSYLNLYAYCTYCVISGVAAYFLASWFGVWGVAIGVMVGYIGKAVHATYLAQWAYRLPWALGRVAVPILCTLLLGLLWEMGSMKFGTSAGTLSTILGLVLIAVLGWLVTFTALERRTIVNTLYTGWRDRQ